MANFSRKSVDYFEMFAEGSMICLEAAKKLQSAFADGTINETELKMVKDAEHKGDKHVHQCLKVIEVAFITPIDRTDIIEILKGIENITDSIDDIANHIHIMCVNEANEYLIKFVDYIVESCEKLCELMKELKKFKKSLKTILELIIEINRIEEDGDRTYFDSMKDLFANESDPITIIKNKELYHLMEHSLDCCEDVADMVEKILVAKT
ncbi:MAG: DUF47 domain-containing protein [Anaerofustis sp.]